MTKKKVLLLALSLLLIPFYTIAQDNTFDDDSTMTTTTTMTDTSSDSTSNLSLNEIKQIQDKEFGNIGFGFCNEGIDNLSSSLNYAVSQGTPFKICLYFNNTNDKDMSLDINMVDAITDAKGNELCDYNSLNIQNFFNENDLQAMKGITIPANNYVVKEFPIVFPVGIDGDLSACMTFRAGEQVDTNAMIQVVFNQYAPMHFFVGDLKDIKNELQISNIKTEINENKDLILSFDIINAGNLEDTFEISGTISNIFGFKKEFPAGSQKNILPGGSMPITINLGSIPSYGGLFNIQINGFASPFFSYNISSSTINPELLDNISFTVSTSYFKMPWLVLIIIVCAICIIILLTKKRKVVYIQAPTPGKQQ